MRSVVQWARHDGCGTTHTAGALRPRRPVPGPETATHSPTAARPASTSSCGRWPARPRPDASAGRSIQRSSSGSSTIRVGRDIDRSSCGTWVPSRTSLTSTEVAPETSFRLAKTPMDQLKMIGRARRAVTNRSSTSSRASIRRRCITASCSTARSGRRIPAYRDGRRGDVPRSQLAGEELDHEPGEAARGGSGPRAAGVLRRRRSRASTARRCRSACRRTCCR